MEQVITLDDVRRAQAARDPSLADLMLALCNASEPRVAVRDEALTWQKMRRKQMTRSFRKLAPEARRQQRLADWKTLEAPDAEVPLPDRLWLHQVLQELWQDGSPWARRQLISAIGQLPLKWGPWRAMKQIFKEAEEKRDWEMFGALAARFDTEYTQWRQRGDVKRPTLRYLVRRAWRTLRRLGVHMPSVYPDAAVELLRHYPERAMLRRSWIANQIFFHELSGAYTRGSFRRTDYARGRGAGPNLQHRAFAAAWQRTPRPLFALLESADSDVVRAFAAESLKADFRTQLREVEASWVVRLIGVRSAAVDKFVVWILDNVPRFEPGAFRQLGLHDAVLSMLDSASPEAAAWSAQYARTHGRDLPLGRLVRLANSDHDAVRQLARDLLRDRDPRTDVGLEAWGQLLGTRHGHDLAAEALQEHFGANELTLDWFRERLLSGVNAVVQFVTALLPKVHPEAQIPTSFYAGLLDDPKVDRRGAQFALRALSNRDLALVDVDVLRRAVLFQSSRGAVQGWVREGKLQAQRLGVDFVKSLASPSSWDADAWIAALRTSEREWARSLKFDDALSDWAMELLGDPRVFTASEVGLAWLLDMVSRSEPRFHDFAVTTLTRSFAPADFVASGDAMAGAERLYEMATSEGPSDEPERKFALHYLRLHHPQIHIDERERSLAAGAELPAAFLTFERASAMAADERKPVRDVALAWMKQELVRWQPSLAQLVALSELPHDDVGAFVALALTAEDRNEHRRYRLDPARLNPEGVYRFCESLHAGTRALGMRLISLHSRLAVPEELFRLTESPDRQVRAFVVRQLWAQYRARPSSTVWQPPTRQDDDGPQAAPVPDRWPAEQGDVRAFLRRSLFGIPPARLPKKSSTDGLRPLPARRAKLALIEVCRDLALDDREFAARVTPLFQEFLGSRGQAESAACLVALTRIRARWSDLGGLPANPSTGAEAR
ncbi:MAG: hypothetical protein KTR31_16110 [Myxococcales bacterium]|nr:hypothetical protein [Myxococcales bacterium]